MASGSATACAAIVAVMLAPAFAAAAPADRRFVGDAAVEADAAAEPVVASDASSSTTPTSASEAGTLDSAIDASPASGSAATPATKASPPSKPRPDRRFPARLTIAGGPTVGPHTFGNEECRSEEARCETHGTFLGVGVQAELRLRLYRPLVGHVRGLFVGNASPRDPVHRGLVGGGIGLGAYSRRLFVRAEYLLVDAFGDNRFARPFGEEQVGRDRWGRHAGLFSLGARLPFAGRWGAELWGGPMIGPRSVRTLPDEPADRRTLVTFLVGINIAYDLVTTAPRKRR